ncbi:MAG: peptidylprolyl isomerase [Gemmataceae bacterium]
MSLWSSRNSHLCSALVAGILGSLVGLGCGKKAEVDVSGKETAPETQAQSGQTGTSKTVDAVPVSRNGAVQRDRLHASFTDAVRGPDNPPADAVRPPDETVSGKKVHRILDQVRTTWDEIRFTTPAGKKISYRAKVTTTEGTFEVQLLSDQAPNHVRNFVALARAGYYDQLQFERVRQDQNEMKQELHWLEAGCPLGTGMSGTGSIGYWVKEEFTPAEKMTHEEGVLGAIRGEEPDSAGTRFYVNLAKAPFLDGNYTIFGKVIDGMDLVRKIGRSPVVIDDEGNRRPEKAVVIEKITITTQELP